MNIENQFNQTWEKQLQPPIFVDIVAEDKNKLNKLEVHFLVFKVSF